MHNICDTHFNMEVNYVVTNYPPPPGYAPPPPFFSLFVIIKVKRCNFANFSKSGLCQFYRWHTRIVTLKIPLVIKRHESKHTFYGAFYQQSVETFIRINHQF